MSVHNHSDRADQKLSGAIFVNVLLTIAQVAGGVISGSLSLIADALHNLSDAGAILIALVARKIGKRDADENLTYGYKRAEILGTLINSATLIIVGLYLIYEALNRYFNPTPIDGWMVLWIGALALAIDVGTAILTYSAGAKESINIRAAFVHNVSDALASVAVIVAGALIISFEFYAVDVVAAAGISAYVVYQGATLLRRSIAILMQAVPEGISTSEIKTALEGIPGVQEVSHIHVWQLDDRKLFFEGHFSLDGESQGALKQAIRETLLQRFDISHTTIEVD